MHYPIHFCRSSDHLVQENKGIKMAAITDPSENGVKNLRGG